MEQEPTLSLDLSMDMELVIFNININIIYRVTSMCFFFSFIHMSLDFQSTFGFMCAGFGYPYAGKPQQPGKSFFFFFVHLHKDQE